MSTVTEGKISLQEDRPCTMQISLPKKATVHLQLPQLPKLWTKNRKMKACFCSMPTKTETLICIVSAEVMKEKQPSHITRTGCMLMTEKGSSRLHRMRCQKLLPADHV